MRRFIIFGMLLCMLSSARGELPTKLLTKEQMIPILVDLEVAEAIAWYYANDEETAHWIFNKNACLICQEYNIDLDTFQESCQYYFGHLEIMQEIYGAVVKRLEALTLNK